MKKITIYPAPHMELRIHANDEMIVDLNSCQMKGEEKCSGCSWSNIKIGAEKVCCLPALRTAPVV